jgi:ribosome-associated heat shock protein Hsp15
MSDSERMRIDKWLWVARFFKTRSLAAAAIAGHKIRCHGEHVKPARELKIGDTVEINLGRSVVVVIVQAFSDQRRPAAEARLLYSETADSRERRLRDEELRRLAPVPGSNLKGRPTKRGARLIRGMTGCIHTAPERAQPPSPTAPILATPRSVETAMPDTHRLLDNLRQLTIDGALILSFVVLVAVELPL